MVDILITDVAEESKQALARQAAQRGLTLDAYLREMLEHHAQAEEAPETVEPLGSWLVGISRPGADLDDALAELRSAPVRRADLE